MNTTRSVTVSVDGVTITVSVPPAPGASFMPPGWLAFNVNEARILLAAVHQFAKNENSRDTQELLAKVTRMADTLEAKERSWKTS